jgi:hypothetical protein
VDPANVCRARATRRTSTKHRARSEHRRSKEAKIVIKNWRRHYNAARPTLNAGISTAGTRGSRLASSKRDSENIISTLRLQSDHSVGAGHVT